jgi:hypothetical protein
MIDRLKILNIPNYAAYLKSELWAEKRKAFYRSRTFRKQYHGGCAICLSRNAPLQLHHVNYSRLGCEPTSDLVPLCDTCHSIVHSKTSLTDDAASFRKTVFRLARKVAKRRKRKELRLFNKSMANPLVALLAIDATDNIKPEAQPPLPYGQSYEDWVETTFNVPLGHNQSTKMSRKKKQKPVVVDRSSNPPTADEIASLQTGNGGWTRESLAKLGVPWPPKQGWRRRLEQRAVVIPDSYSI